MLLLKFLVASLFFTQFGVSLTESLRIVIIQSSNDADQAVVDSTDVEELIFFDAIYLEEATLFGAIVVVSSKSKSSLKSLEIVEKIILNKGYLVELCLLTHQHTTK